MGVIVVIGGAGFLAGHVIPDLVQEGHAIRAIDIVPPDGAVRLRFVLDRIGYRWKSVLDLEPSDLSDADVVLYLAAQADVPLGISSPTFTFQQNVLSTVHYMDLVSKLAKPPRTLYMSSESVYGVVPRALQPIREDAPLNPTNAYAVSKLCAEAVVRAYAVQYGLPAVILRSTTMYGPASRSKQVIPIFIRQALAGKAITVEGDGSQSRDFNYVRNVVNGIKLAMTDPHAHGTYNIGSGREISIREVAELIVRLANSKSEVKFGPWRPGEQGVQLNISIDRAVHELGYGVLWSLEEGLADTIRYWASA